MYRNNLCFLFALMIGVAAFPAHAQLAKKVGDAYQVPVATSDNVIELQINNSDVEKLGDIHVAVTSAPQWIKFETEDHVIDTLSSEHNALVKFYFSVSKDAIIGDQAELKFEVYAGDLLLNEKKIAISVDGPRDYALYQNFPNPFSDDTQISFDIPEESRVSITVHDILGRQVASVIDETMPAGHYQVFLSADDLASGTYFYIFNASGVSGKSIVLTNKMIHLK